MKDTAIIKRALVKGLGKHHVLSVRHDRGTAAHWILVSLALPEESRSHVGRLEDLAKEIIWNTDVELSQYPDEMTQDMHNCLLISTRFI